MHQNFSSSALIISDSPKFTEKIIFSLEKKIKLVTHIGSSFPVTLPHNTSPSYLIIFQLQNEKFTPQINELIIDLIRIYSPKTVLVKHQENELSDFVNYAENGKSNIRVLEVCDPYGLELSQSTSTQLSAFLKDIALNKSSTLLPQNFKFYPVFQADILPALLTALFSAGSKNCYFTVKTEHFTAGEIATSVQSEIHFGNSKPPPLPSSVKTKQSLPRFTPLHQPEVEIPQTIAALSRPRFQVLLEKEVVASRIAFDSVPPPAPVHKEELLPVSPQATEQSDLNSVLERINRELSQKEKPAPTPDHPSSHLSRLQEVLSAKKRPFISNRKLSRVSLLILLPALYLSTLVLFSFLSYKSATKALNSLDSLEFDKLSNQLKETKILLNIVTFEFRLFSFIPVPAVQQIHHKLDLANAYIYHLKEVGDLLVKTQVQGRQFASRLFSSTTPPASSFFTDLPEKLESIDWHLGQIESISKDINQPFLDKLLPKLKFTRDTISKLSTVSPSLQSLFGFNGSKTYLVLFQNNMELRSTGGFIGSVGLLTMDQGTLSDFQVYDVYSLDGQLKGHVEPPAALKAYLGEAGWYLRDSNWDPDFPTSAKRASWFLEKELGRKVDGVIGTNLNFAKSLLKTTGPITLMDFNENITSENLFERAEYQSESGFFPGSSNKKDFLGSLAKTFLNQFKTMDSTGQARLALETLLALEKKDLLVSVDFAAHEFRRAGWDGSIATPACPEPSCVADYLYVVDNNVGVNKVNYFIIKDQKIDIKIGDSKIDHRLTITYQNRANTETWPAGRYKNYLRIYLDPRAQITSFSIKDTGSEAVGLPFETTLEPNHKVIAGLVEVPIGQSKTVQLDFTVPKNLLPSHTYRLSIPKQPGTSDALSLEINTRFPILYTNPPLDKSKQGDSSQLTPITAIKYNMALTQDFLLELSF